MSVFKLGNKKPEIDPSVYIAPTATVVGDVSIGKNSSIWFNCVARGDVAAITIGERTNIQDITMLHVNFGKPLVIGSQVTVGHSCIVHGCIIEDDCLIGMGAIIMNGAKIGTGSIVASGSVVLQESVIPPFSLVTGTPGRVKRTLDKDALKIIRSPADIYEKNARTYRSSEELVPLA